MSTSGTEAANPQLAALDRLATPELVATLAADQAEAAGAVQAAAAELARAVELATPRLARGGRLIYVGAGTSGRLGLLDSVELWPTFSWPAARARALLAGGEAALWQAVEGAEDDAAQGAADLHALTPTPDDVVIDIAASGRTPYTLGAIAAARALGCLTIGIANNPATPLPAAAEVGIVLDTGPEAITGSTRLKAGTAQKIALNTLSTALMVRLGKVYGNAMVDLKATNAKLRRRAECLVGELAGVDEATARQALEANGYRVKAAVVTLRCGLDAPAATAALSAAGGVLRRTLENSSETR